MTAQEYEILENALVAELVRRAQAGDRDAFGELVGRFERAVFATAMRRLRNWSEAEELTQDVFLQAFTKLDHFARRRLSAAGCGRSPCGWRSTGPCAGRATFRPSRKCWLRP
jgi:hypothetical protein